MIIGASDAVKKTASRDRQTFIAPTPYWQVVVLEAKRIAIRAIDDDNPQCLRSGDLAREFWVQRDAAGGNGLTSDRGKRARQPVGNMHNVEDRRVLRSFVLQARHVLR
jgi:hypothetical protein